MWLVVGARDLRLDLVTRLPRDIAVVNEMGTNRVDGDDNMLCGGDFDTLLSMLSPMPIASRGTSTHTDGRRSTE